MIAFGAWLLFMAAFTSAAYGCLGSRLRRDWVTRSRRFFRRLQERGWLASDEQYELISKVIVAACLLGGTGLVIAGIVTLGL